MKGRNSFDTIQRLWSILTFPDGNLKKNKAKKY
jgi:hypothetical protein